MPATRGRSSGTSRREVRTRSIITGSGQRRGRATGSAGDGPAPAEQARYFRPPGLDRIEALHARFVQHAYRPHSHTAWTVAVMQQGAARFTVDSSPQRADAGELFLLEPEAVHTGMAAVPEGWRYQVLYVEPEVLSDWAEHDGRPPRAAKWVVFQDPSLRGALLDAHAALAAEGRGLAVEEPVLGAVAALSPHLREAIPERDTSRPEHAAVRRARAHLLERWDQPVSLAELSAVAGLSRFELVRRFGADTGLTPHAFQTQVRVRRARRMLDGGVPPAAVAADCGFADQPHLTRVFKRLVGVSPGRYARGR